MLQDSKIMPIFAITIKQYKMTTLQLKKKMSKVQKQINKCGDTYSIRRSDLQHDYDLLINIHTKLERLENSMHLLKIV